LQHLFRIAVGDDQEIAVEMHGRFRLARGARSEAQQRDIVAAAIDLLADRIALGHAKDRTATGGFIAAGQGVLDFHHYVTRLAAAGFAGALVTHGLEAADAGSVARFLSQVLTDCGAGTPT